VLEFAVSNACHGLFSEPCNCDRPAWALPILSPTISNQSLSLLLYTGSNYGLSKLVKDVDPHNNKLRIRLLKN